MARLTSDRVKVIIFSLAAYTSWASQDERAFTDLANSWVSIALDATFIIAWTITMAIGFCPIITRASCSNHASISATREAVIFIWPITSFTKSVARSAFVDVLRMKGRHIIAIRAITGSVGVCIEFIVSPAFRASWSICLANFTPFNIKIAWFAILFITTIFIDIAGWTYIVAQVGVFLIVFICGITVPLPEIPNGNVNRVIKTARC